MPHLELRRWQIDAMAEWRGHDCHGIVEVVTGGGKTFFALACAREAKFDTSLVVVPTVALLDQWWGEAAGFFGVSLDEINIISGRSRVRSGTINIAVLNTASKHLLREQVDFLIVDECHKAASEKYRNVLDIESQATLGLSATPDRPYDDWLHEVLVPKLGPVIFKYTYRDALRDKVIVPFNLRNVVFDLEADSQREYDKLTKAIARSVSSNGPDAPETVSLYLRRARVQNLSLTRIRLAVLLVARHRGQRVLVFHEDIEACGIIMQALIENGVAAGVYHSRMNTRDRAEMLLAFREGRIDVLVTCRALDEGFNVPETQVGIIAASTATQRQRIQRLGRILRPSEGKEGAIVYTLAATAPEVSRLREEEETLEGVAQITWGRA